MNHKVPSTDHVTKSRRTDKSTTQVKPTIFSTAGNAISLFLNVQFRYIYIYIYMCSFSSGAINKVLI